MKIEGSKALIRKLGDLPKAQRRHIKEAMVKNGQEGVRVAKTLVPRKLGTLADTIDYKLIFGGMGVEIQAGGDTRDENIKANTLEGGRDPNARGGAMDAQPFIGPTRKYLAKRHKNRIKRAVSKAAKEVSRNG